jgi:hypothetical protein
MAYEGFLGRGGGSKKAGEGHCQGKNTDRGFHGYAAPFLRLRWLDPGSLERRGETAFEPSLNRLPAGNQQRVSTALKWRMMLLNTEGGFFANPLVFLDIYRK